MCTSTLHINVCNVENFIESAVSSSFSFPLNCAGFRHKLNKLQFMVPKLGGHNPPARKALVPALVRGTGRKALVPALERDRKGVKAIQCPRLYFSWRENFFYFPERVPGAL